MKRAGLVRKRITNINGINTTVWVKIGDDPKRKKQSKVTKLMRSFNTITKKLNADIKNGGEDGDLAAAARLMMYTGIRVGNENSATGYKSLRDKKVKQTYGLTTLKKEHVQFDKDGVLLKFQGKRDVEQNIRIKEAHMVALVKHFYERAEKGEEIIPATPYEIAKYVKKTVGKEYTPKDLRMVRANREALVHMNRIRKKPKRETKGEVNADINEVLDKVSAALGNTRGVAKRSYVSEFLLEEFKSARLKPKKKKVKKK